MKAEGEPEGKKGKTELEEDEDKDLKEDEVDESPEEVEASYIWICSPEPLFEVAQNVFTEVQFNKSVSRGITELEP